MGLKFPAGNPRTQPVCRMRNSRRIYDLRGVSRLTLRIGDS